MKRRLEEQILLLAYGELDEATAQVVLRRIQENPSLRAIYEEHLRVREATRALPPPPPPSLGSEQLRERILNDSIPRRRAGWSWAFAGGCAALAGMLAILTANLPTGQDTSDSTEKPALTVALNDLPAPHEWVPALVQDIPNEKPGAQPSAETPSPQSTLKKQPTSQRANQVGTKSPEATVVQPAQDAAKGALEKDGDEASTVIVVGANGSAVEFEGTDGVAFGG